MLRLHDKVGLAIELDDLALRMSLAAGMGGVCGVAV